MTIIPSKHTRLYLSAMLFFNAIAIFGQTDFRAGYIVTNDLDTIFGEIDNRGDMRNCRICSFRMNQQAGIMEYQPADIHSYRLTEGKYYISKIVPVNVDKRQVFAEYLVNGITDLYYYRDGSNDHYLIEEEDGSIHELTDKKEKIYVDGKSYERESYKHIGLLKAAFSDCMEVQPEIENASLSHKSLIQITSDYHDYVCDGEKCIIYEKEIPAFRLVVAPLAGIGFSSISFSKHQILTKIHFENNLAPFLGLQLNASAPRINERISLQLASSLSKDYYYGFHQEEFIYSVTILDAHLNTLFLKSSFALKYTFPNGKVRPTVTAGGLMNVLLWGSSGYVAEQVSGQVVSLSAYTDLPINNILWGGFIQLGLDYHLLKEREFFSNLGLDMGKGSSTEASTKLWSVSLSMGTYF
ncbi:MAG: hypothetical protein QNK30_08975 [Bacteroidales bacterium]|nr:hypothetical protein [Bacteroidales bacterium]